MSPGSEDIFKGEATREARRICPQAIWRVVRRKLDQLHHVPALRLERLLGMSAQFWLGLQQSYDLYQALHPPAAKSIAKIKPAVAA